MSLLEVAAKPEEALELSLQDDLSHPIVLQIKLICKELDEKVTKCDIDKIMSNQILLDINKLISLYTQIFFVVSISSLKIIDDLVWKRSYYGVISAMKKERKLLDGNNLLQGFVNEFIQHGVTFYSNMVEKAKLNIKENSFLLASVTKNRCLSNERKISNFLIERAFLYIGDLYRYRLDLLKNSEDFTKSMKYYINSFIVNPYSEYPLNQLGNLYLINGDIFTSTFYYIRGTFSQMQVHLSEKNLQLTFEKTNKIFSSQTNASEHSAIDFFKFGTIFLCEYWMKNMGHVIPEKFFSNLLNAFQQIVFTIIGLKCRTDRDDCQTIILKCFLLNFYCLESLKKSDSTIYRNALSYTSKLAFILLKAINMHLSSIPSEVLCKPDYENMRPISISSGLTGSQAVFRKSEQSPNNEGNVGDSQNNATLNEILSKLRLSSDSENDEGSENECIPTCTSSKRFLRRREPKDQEDSCESEDEKLNRCKDYLRKSTSSDSDEGENLESSYASRVRTKKTKGNTPMLNGKVTNSTQSVNNLTKDELESHLPCDDSYSIETNLDSVLMGCYLESVKITLDWLRSRPEIITLIEELNEGGNIIECMRSTIRLIPDWVLSNQNVVLADDYLFNSDMFTLGHYLFTSLHQDLSFGFTDDSERFILSRWHERNRDESTRVVIFLKKVISTFENFKQSGVTGNSEDLISEGDCRVIRHGRFYQGKIYDRSTSRRDGRNKNKKLDRRNRNSQPKNEDQNEDSLSDLESEYFDSRNKDGKNSKVSFGQLIARAKLKDDILKLGTKMEKEIVQNFNMILIVDSGCICSRRDILGKTLDSGRFLLIIPLETIRQLDSMKESNHLAAFGLKSIITWLRQNKPIRIQQEHENLSNFQLNGGRQKNDSDFKNLSHVLNVGMYFLISSNKTTPVTILLSHSDYISIFGNSKNSPELYLNDKDNSNHEELSKNQLLNICVSATEKGLKIENIDTFNRNHLLPLKNKRY